MYHYGSAVTCVCYIQLAHKEESHNSSAATRYSVIYAFFLDDVILSAKTYKKIMCINHDGLNLKTKLNLRAGIITLIHI